MVAVELAGVNVPVAEMSRAVAFYTELLGHEPLHREPDYVVFEADGARLGLFLSPNPDGHDDTPRVLVRTDDLDAAVARVADLAPIVSDIEEHDGYRLALCADADQNTIEIQER